MECEPTTPQDIADSCESAGNPCDPDSFITRDAAICVARADELEDGLEPWYVHMVYNVGYDRPIWAVSNTTVDDPADCRKSGQDRHIDAETGEILNRGQWMSIC